MKPQTKTFSAIGLVVAVVTTAGLALAQEETPELLVPHTFEPGDVISADQMNSNFDEIAEAVNAVEAQLEALTTQNSINDPGVFLGSVNTSQTGGNFSLLPGAGGATGKAAADASCKANYPGSYAEMDQNTIWQSAVSGDLSEGSYWIDYEVGEFAVSTTRGIYSDCNDWTSADSNEGGYVIGTSVNGEGNSSTPHGILVNASLSTCQIGAVPYNQVAITTYVACYQE